MLYCDVTFTSYHERTSEPPTHAAQAYFSGSQHIHNSEHNNNTTHQHDGVELFLHHVQLAHIDLIGAIVAVVACGEQQNFQLVKAAKNELELLS